MYPPFTRRLHLCTPCGGLLQPVFCTTLGTSDVFLPGGGVTRSAPAGAISFPLPPDLYVDMNPDMYPDMYPDLYPDLLPDLYPDLYLGFT